MIYTRVDQQQQQHLHQYPVTAATMVSSDEIKAEYTSSLADLTFNSKPLINVLTILAEENLAHASDIVSAIEEHLVKVQIDVKLPILYLIDCIAKNIGQTYTALFSQNIVSTFCNVFKMVDEKTRAEMFKLRQTWNEIFPQKKLYAIDVQINMLDPAWPVTAKPPSNSIHLNPKFLLPNQTANTAKTTAQPSSEAIVTDPTTVAATAANLDTETFTMQQKLIQKQKELIELQQKKLELELLQAQVKLQKQMKTNSSSSSSSSAPSTNTSTKTHQNILLKPEVAKQILAGESNKLTRAGLLTSGATSFLSKHGGPRISPVNSVLVAASKPIRDPRLLRQQNATAAAISTGSSNNNTNNSNNNNSSCVQLGSKTSNLDSNNKIVSSISSSNNNNKMSVRDNRNETRLINNKDNSKTDNNNKPKSSPKSSNSNKQLSSSSSRKSSRTKLSSNSDLSTTNLAGAGGKNSLLSISDNNNSKSSSSKNESSKSSPNKHKKKDSIVSRKSLKEMKSSSSRNKNDQVTTFKGIAKGSTKNRNYVRRNRSPSASPDELTRDVDLRSGPPPDKIARTANAALIPEDQHVEEKVTSIAVSVGDSNNTTATITGMDVDLRRLPTAAPIISGKKRPSTETLDQQNAAKKSKKTEMFDVLFGNEDTDLRQLPGLVVPQLDRPPTPPPPIISIAGDSNSNKDKTVDDCIVVVEDGVEQQSPKKQLLKTNLDAIRAKLANATNKEKVMAKSFRKRAPDPVAPQVATIIQEDEDLRILPPPHQISSSSTTTTIIDSTTSQPTKLMSSLPSLSDNISINNKQHRGGVSTSSANNNNNNGVWRPIGGSNFNNNNNTNSKFLPLTTTSRGGIDVDVDLDCRDVDQQTLLPIVVDSVKDDEIKTINIDDIPRDIRYYDETAIIFLSWNDPREISFRNDSRRVIFDDKEIYVLQFNVDYKELSINGNKHQVRLGTPTREIYIDGKPYECYFGGPGITIELNSRLVTIKLDGPPPQVRIGTRKRTDLVAGAVSSNNHKNSLPSGSNNYMNGYSDGGSPYNNYDGDDNNSQHSTGSLQSYQQRGYNLNEQHQKKRRRNNNNHQSQHQHHKQQQQQRIDDVDRGTNSNSPQLFQNFMHQQQQNTLDALSWPPVSIGADYQHNHHQGENISTTTSRDLPILTTEVDHNSCGDGDQQMPTSSSSLLPANLNVNELFQKLIATGIVATSNSHNDDKNTATITTTATTLQSSTATTTTTMVVAAQPPPPPVKRNMLENMKLITFDRPETLKQRQNILYDQLYCGMQCSSCGMRFPREHTVQYSQHLDWHFRQNRKGKKNIRVAASRRWYYPVTDWLNYEEIEDLEEREKNYFDQQSQAEAAAAAAANGDGDGNDEIDIPSVPADPDTQDAHCDVCEDKFDHFFNEEKEEWHLRNAIRFEDKTFHPVCYDDYQASLLQQSLLLDDDHEKSLIVNDDHHNKDQIIPGLEIIVDDDDDEDDNNNGTEATKDIDDDEVIITTESDDLKSDANKMQNDETDNKTEDDDDDDDDDVIIHEVIPEKIIVDDDDDDDDQEIDKENTTSTVAADVPIKIEQFDDDGFMDVEEGLLSIKKNSGQIHIKSEPLDETTDDDITLLDTTNTDTQTKDDSTNNSNNNNNLTTTIIHPGLTSSIDGNTEMNAASSSGMGGKIKINITKPLPLIVPSSSTSSLLMKESKDLNCDNNSKIDCQIDPSQPLPPGEEPPIQLNVKPALRNIKLKTLPPVQKGSELTGMCSIM